MKMLMAAWVPTTNLQQQTFEDVGVTNGKISPEQWQQLVKANPQMISYMTLPVLSQLTTKYPVTK